MRAPLPAQASWDGSCPAPAQGSAPLCCLQLLYPKESSLSHLLDIIQFNKMFADARRRQFSMALFRGIVHVGGEELFRNVLKPLELLWCLAKDFTR